jgi:hypothetical protein
VECIAILAVDMDIKYGDKETDSGQHEKLSMHSVFSQNNQPRGGAV